MSLLSSVFSVMLQGPIMVALSEIKNNRLMPFGSRTLIHDAGDPVLLIRFPEFEHNIVFPKEIQSPQL
jgi:hypothetical protein